MELFRHSVFTVTKSIRAGPKALSVMSCVRWSQFHETGRQIYFDTETAPYFSETISNAL